MQIEAVAIAALRQREDLVLVAEMANDARLFQSSRDQPDRLATLELIHDTEADEVIQPNFHRQRAAAGLAIAAQTVVIAMPGVEAVNVGRAQWDTIHDALRSSQGLADSGVSQGLCFGQIQRAFVDGAAGDGANHAIAAHA